MKKTLVSVLTTALAVGVASTTFAASNPFSDVPADHWSYDAVTQLAQDGVINGYGDGTFRGDKNITRYEMAQMVAKAMAKSDVSAKDKALIDKLAAEFSDELNNLGVRVANLEKHADMVKWEGLAEYTYTDTKVVGGSDNINGTGISGHHKNYELVFRLEPTAEVNEHWNIHARMDGNYALNKDEQTSNGVELKRAWAEGQYGDFNVKLGKLPNSINLLSITDDPYSGAEVSYGKDLKVTAAYGRLSGDSIMDRFKKYGDRVADRFGATYSFNGQTPYYGVAVQYDKEDAPLSGGIAWQRTDIEDVGLTVNGNNIGTVGQGLNVLNALGINGLNVNSKNDIWSLNAKYKFADKAYFKAEYARSNMDLEVPNTDLDSQKTAYSFQLGYGEAKKEEPGSWGAYIAYRRLGFAAAPWSTYDDALMSGQKGWEIGAEYTFAQNIVGFLKYGRGSDMLVSDLNANGIDDDCSKLFGRVDFFF